MAFLYYLSVSEAELDLALAELWALTGCEANGRLAWSAFGCDISRSAYVALCAEEVACGASLEALCATTLDRQVAAEGFRVELVRLESGLAWSSVEVARQVADAIRGAPDLSHPRIRFVVFASRGRWVLGRVLSRGARGRAFCVRAPRSYSCSLPARQARALVNLVAAPGDTLLDPCCGAGTCVVQALAVGIRARGCDVNAAVVRAASENLQAAGFEADVWEGDVREVTGEYDAAVLDLPYGHSSRAESDLYENALNNIAPRVFKLGVVTGQPVEALFEGLGLRVLRLAKVRKNRLVRHFYVLSGLRAWGGT